MKHIINGCSINLRSLSSQELENLIGHVQARLAQTQEELDSVMGEHIRRSDNVHQLRFEYEGPSVA